MNSQGATRNGNTYDKRGICMYQHGGFGWTNPVSYAESASYHNTQDTGEGCLWKLGPSSWECLRQLLV